MHRTLRSPVMIGLLVVSSMAAAQNVAINATGAAPAPSAMLDITSVTDGLLIPRMTEAQRLAIPAPANGLWVFQTDDGVGRHGLWYYDATIPAWVRLSDGLGWSLVGNAGTVPTTNYLGTSDANDLVFRINNVERMRVLSTGETGINTTTPTEALEVNGGMRLAVSGAPNFTNQAGVIRYNPGTTFHEGNVDGTLGGWQRLENSERIVTGDEYETSIDICGPGIAEVAAQNGFGLNANETPFPTAAYRAGKTQYLFRASELTNFGLCAGDITSIAIFFQNDDNNAIQYGCEVRLSATALGNLATGLNAAASAAPINFRADPPPAGLPFPPIVVGSGWYIFNFNQNIFNWNGAANIIVEICFTKPSAVAGFDPQPAVSNVFASATAWGRSPLAGTNGCTLTQATSPQVGTLAKRAVIRFTGQAEGPQPALAFGDYLQYGGGLLIEETPGWSAGPGIFLGPGVIRAENAVYDGNVQLSDHVFDRYFDGSIREEDISAAMDYDFVPLDELKDHLREQRHLPAFPSREEWARKGSPSLGELSTDLWETVETQALYIIELQQRISKLEDRVFSGDLSDAERASLLRTIEKQPGLSDQDRQRLRERVTGPACENARTH